MKNLTLSLYEYIAYNRKNIYDYFKNYFLNILEGVPSSIKVPLSILNM